MAFDPITDLAHPDWCAKGHACGLGEHRAQPVTLDAGQRGVIVLTRVLAATGRQHVEIRTRISLARWRGARTRPSGANPDPARRAASATRSPLAPASRRAWRHRRRIGPSWARPMPPSCPVQPCPGRSLPVSADVKPAPRRRGKRVVENTEFDAFARRIVRAYARRVADGDIEALTSLRQLASTVEDATRDAVHGLRGFGYSWADIAARLGVSRQAAQMRWGAHPTDCGRLDQRLLQHGLGVSVAVLVAVFADHHPGTPATASCPACAYAYPARRYRLPHQRGGASAACPAPTRRPPRPGRAEPGAARGAARPPPGAREPCSRTTCLGTPHGRQPGAV